MTKRPMKDAWLSYPGCEWMYLSEYLRALQNHEIEPGLSPGGVAGRLGITRKAVTTLARRGHLPPRVVLDDNDGKDNALAIVEFTEEVIQAAQNRHERQKHDPRKKGRRTAA